MPSWPYQKCPGQPPALRVLQGGVPDDAELAALVVALTTLGGSAAAPRPSSRWADRRAALREPLHPGPGAWVAGARPSR
jgi:hypothetical protein